MSYRLSILVLMTAAAVGAHAQAVRSPAAKSVSRAITIVTKPKASVWIDGVFFGQTDSAGRLSIRSAPVGNRILRVRLDGFKEVKKPLRANARNEIAVDLTQPADEAELAFQKGEALALSDRQKAIAAYETAIRLRPVFPEALLALARARYGAGDLDGALRTVSGLKRVAPGFAPAWAVEGRIYNDLNDEKRAVAAFKRAIAVGGGYQAEAYTGLGLLNKDKAEAAGSSGDIAQESEYYAEAARYLAVAAKQLSTSADATIVYQLLGLVYERQKKYVEAIRVYEDFLTLFPDSPEAATVQSFIVQIKKQMAQPD